MSVSNIGSCINRTCFTHMFVYQLNYNVASSHWLHTKFSSISKTRVSRNEIQNKQNSIDFVFNFPSFRGLGCNGLFKVPISKFFGKGQRLQHKKQNNNQLIELRQTQMRNNVHCSCHEQFIRSNYDEWGMKLNNEQNKINEKSLRNRIFYLSSKRISYHKFQHQMAFDFWSFCLSFPHVFCYFVDFFFSCANETFGPIYKICPWLFRLSHSVTLFFVSFFLCSL